MPYLRADLDHIALDTKRDPLALLDFYASVLGFEPLHVSEYKSKKMPFPSVRASPTTVIDFFPRKDDEPQARAEGLRQSNHFCFALQKNEWEEIRKRLDERGITVECPDGLLWGARGYGGVSFKFDDPDGNVIELRYYKDVPNPFDVSKQEN